MERLLGTPRSMKIGFYLRPSHAGNGGAFTFQESVASALRSMSTEHKIIFFKDSNTESFTSNSTTSPEVVDLGKYRSERSLRSLLKESRYADSVVELTHRIEANLTGRDRESILQRALRDHPVDLIWFLGGYLPVSIPFVATAFDVQHRFHPYFPEVSRYGWSWNDREEFFRTILPRSTYTIVGTEHGRDELMTLYGLAKERIAVIPFPTPDFALANAAAELSRPNVAPARDYILYPAQCWPHKNHVLLLEALRKLRDLGEPSLDVVFVGEDKENGAYLRSLVNEYGLNDQVHFLGLVSTETLAALYQYAFALAYPSFFGPDNLPPLEAFALGCPVLAADVPGAREQLKDAALFFDPTDADTFISALQKLRDTPKLRSTLVRRGKKLALGLTGEHYASEVFRLCDSLAAFFKCWDQSSPDKYR